MTKSKLKWRVYLPYFDVNFGLIKQGEYTSKQITLEDAMTKTVIALSTIPVSIIGVDTITVYNKDKEQSEEIKTNIYRIEPLKINTVSPEIIQNHLKFNKLELENFIAKRKIEPFNSYIDLIARVGFSYPDKWEHFFSEINFSLV